MTNADVPSINGPNGVRDSTGRFAKGNRGGPGNPYAAHVNRLRIALFNAISEDDLRAVVAALLVAAKKADVAAAKELFMRTLGPPVDPVLEERMAALEERVKELLERKEAPPSPTRKSRPRMSIKS